MEEARIEDLDVAAAIEDNNAVIKSIKTVTVDGFVFTEALWNEIKDTYIPHIPSAYEIQIAEECKSYAQSALVTLDKLITAEEYNPMTSPKWLQNKVYNFLNSQLVKEAADGDLVLLEQYLEVLCGVESKIKQELVGQIIDQTVKRIEEKWFQTYH